MANGAPGVPVGALWVPLSRMAPIWCPWARPRSQQCPNGAHGRQMGTDYSIFQKKKTGVHLLPPYSLSLILHPLPHAHIICINAWMIYPKTCILLPLWLYLSWWLVWFVCVSLLHLISWSTVRTLFVLSLGERCEICIPYLSCCFSFWWVDYKFSWNLLESSMIAISWITVGYKEK